MSDLTKRNDDMVGKPIPTQQAEFKFAGLGTAPDGECRPMVGFELISDTPPTKITLGISVADCEALHEALGKAIENLRMQ